MCYFYIVEKKLVWLKFNLNFVSAILHYLLILLFFSFASNTPMKQIVTNYIFFALFLRWVKVSK